MQDTMILLSTNKCSCLSTFLWHVWWYVGLENRITSDELQEGWRTMHARKPAWMAGDSLAMAVRVVPDEGMRWGRQVIVDKVQPLWVADKKLYAACIWGEGVQPGHHQSAGRVCRHPAPCTCTCPQCVS